MTTKQFSFCRGDTPSFSIKFKLPRLSYALVVPSLVVAPSIGAMYTNANGDCFYVYSVSGTTIRFFSTLKQDTIPATGSLTQVTGTGDATLAYTTKTANSYVDLTGLTVRFSILSQVANEPTPSQILLNPQTMTVNGTTASCSLTAAQTLALPVTRAFGFFEIKNGTSYISESLDNQFLVININKEKITP